MDHVHTELKHTNMNHVWTLEGLLSASASYTFIPRLCWKETREHDGRVPTYTLCGMIGMLLKGVSEDGDGASYRFCLCGCMLSVSNPDARGVDLYYCRPNRDVTERKHAKYLIIRVDQFQKVMGEKRISRDVMQAVKSFWFAASYYTEKQTDKWRWMERDRHGEKRRNDHILIHQIPSSVSQSRS